MYYRLEIRADEGRVTEIDLQIAGVRQSHQKKLF